MDIGDVCSFEGSLSSIGDSEGIGHFLSGGPAAIAVDQTTGYVYVFTVPLSVRQHNLIEVFSADGSEVIARFGDAGAQSETFEAGPKKIHPFGGNRSMVVDDTGKLYVFDSSNSESRVMCFRPESTGDYKHYVYCGRSQDIESKFVTRLELDDAGHLYLANPGFIEERSSTEPSAAALCTYLTHGQLQGMTIDPVTGELFYYNYSANDRRVHRLKPCDPAKGQFEEAQAPVKISPTPVEMSALAFNPTLSWGPNRPPGALYGADPVWHENETPAYRGLGYIFAPAQVRSPAVLSESVSNTRTDLDGPARGNRSQRLRHPLRLPVPERGSVRSQCTRGTLRRRSRSARRRGEIGGGSVGEAARFNLGPRLLIPPTASASSRPANATGKEARLARAKAKRLPFATYPLFPPGLPDHRAYEMVSPAQKHGGEVISGRAGFGSSV